MRIVEEYIKKRKKAVNQNNEAEYVKVLDLVTIGQPLLEDYTRFIEQKLLENILGVEQSELLLKNK